MLDPDGTRGAVETFAQRLRSTYEAVLRPAGEAAAARAHPEEAAAEEDVDSLKLPLSRAFEKVRSDKAFMDELRTTGVPWGVIVGKIKEHLPTEWHDLDNRAYQSVKPFLDETFGQGNWDTEKRPTRDGSRSVTWAFVRNRVDE
ncbi:hypothetical protein [Symbiobacterium thermophilum]|nr:hypothetical protein [Symbiobacterium thermophilum]